MCIKISGVMSNRIPHRDIISWNVLLSLFSNDGYSQEVLNLFHSMEFEAIQLDIISFVCALDACMNYKQSYALDA